jgi:hypothetical protein
LTSSEPPLVPSGAWEWAFLTQVLTLAFAYDLRHALERLAAHSGEFYDPVLSYTMWSLVDAARGDAELTKGPGVAFPGAGAGPENEASAALLPWAQALLRYDGEIPTWCAHALYTHHPSALDTLEDLLARRQSVNAELAAADERIAGGESKRASKVMWDAPSKRRTFDVLVRRASVTTFFLRVVDNAPPPAPAPAPASLSRRPSRRISLRRKPKLAGNQPCSPECRIALRRTLTAAMALATRQSSSEKFSTVDYYVEYTYEGLQCDSCRHNVQEALVWIWCMKMPWRGGVGL